MIAGRSGQRASRRVTVVLSVALAVCLWAGTGMLAASASSNETGYLTHKFARSLGMLAFDNQARV